MPGPLEDLLVIDASWGMPGAVLTMLLADYGARVVKVERPGGGTDRDGLNRRAWDRGKWSVELDLDDARDRAMLGSLLDSADVFVESFGPRATDRPGLDNSSLRRTNPGLVSCSLTGYGKACPWKDRPGYEALVAARLGFMTEQPGHREGPIFLGHPSIGYTTAFLAMIGVLAALRARRHTGEGQEVDVSLLDGVLGQAPLNWMWNEKDASYLGQRKAGPTFGRMRAIADLFICADGRYVMPHTGGEGSFKRMMDVIGLGEHIQEITDRLDMSVPLDDNEFAAVERVAEMFLARPRDEWVRRLQDADVAVVPVLEPGEALLDEQVELAGVVVDIHDPELAVVRQAGPCIRFSAFPAAAAAPAPAPAVGAHNDHIDELLARRPVRAEASKSLDHALQGLRVLDFSSFFACAYGAKFLADLGADVIKVEPLRGDPMRPLPEPFEGSQRGKRGMAVDLRTPEGREVVHRLVATADVVMHNLRPGKAEMLGIGYEELAAIDPSLVYCYQPGWGSKGPKAHLKSFAPLLSGFTGLNYEAAGRGNPPVRRARASEDYYNGFMGAVGVLMALEWRARTGRGQYLESPQLFSSLTVTTEQFLDPAGNLLTEWVLDEDQMGYSALYRLYPTADGFVCIACVGDAAFRRLAEALDLRPVLGMPRFSTCRQRKENDAELAGLLGPWFATRTSEAACAVLDGARVPCEVARDTPYMTEIWWEDWALDSGAIYEQHHPTYGWVREVGQVIRLDRTPGVRRGPHPLLGEHTTQILLELGYDGDRVEQLMTNGVCAQS